MSSLKQLLLEWADDFEEAAKNMPTRLQGTILMTRAQQCRDQASAQDQGDEEPVGFTTEHHLSAGLPYFPCKRESESEWRVPVYAAKPESAGVPDRKVPGAYSSDREDGYCDGWNDCIDEVEALANQHHAQGREQDRGDARAEVIATGGFDKKWVNINWLNVDDLEPGDKLYTHPAKPEGAGVPELSDLEKTGLAKAAFGNHIPRDAYILIDLVLNSVAKHPAQGREQWVKCSEDTVRMALVALEKFTADLRHGAGGDPEPLEHHYGMQAINELIAALPPQPQSSGGES